MAPLGGLEPKRLSGVRFSCTTMMMCLKVPCGIWAAANAAMKEIRNSNLTAVFKGRPPYVRTGV
jgi:hypothetical protein